jgi:hypothetical protein
MACWSRNHRSHIIAVVLVLAFGCLAAGARADSQLERLLMPGPVVAAHAKIENQCSACHEPFSKATQDRLCLGCHTAIRQDVAAGTGFHGRDPLARVTACKSCHTDHKARDADIVELDRASFDHTLTDYRLAGAHRFLACADCHQAGKRWAEAPATCFGCHAATEPHKGNLGKQCETCHRETTWHDVVAFDHEKTRFPLHGKHAGVACLSCHLGEIYKELSTACSDCHAIQDVHGGRFGSQCQACHSDTGWTPAKFDHAAHTRFPLTGAHGKAQCRDCHGGDVLARISMACFDCHAAQDVHKVQLGRSCGDCHSDVSWRSHIVFDHDLTRFPLSGLHIAVACEACHATPAFKDAGTACSDCHAKDDVHLGRFAARCESCHTANGWTRVTFNHDTDTRYPLTGKHAATACYDCHVQKNVSDARLPTACASCHAKDDVHHGKFGNDCQRCHDTRNFTTAVIRQ